MLIYLVMLLILILIILIFCFIYYSSCWAFATAAVIESYNALRGNTLTDLSAQQLVDCNTVNYGCNGGDPYQAFYYEIVNGSMSAADYPVSIV